MFLGLNVETILAQLANIKYRKIKFSPALLYRQMHCHYPLLSSIPVYPIPHEWPKALAFFMDIQCQFFCHFFLIRPKSPAVSNYIYLLSIFPVFKKVKNRKISVQKTHEDRAWREEKQHFQIKAKMGRAFIHSLLCLKLAHLPPLLNFPKFVQTLFSDSFDICFFSNTFASPLVLVNANSYGVKFAFFNQNARYSRTLEEQKNWPLFTRQKNKEYG